MSTNNTDIDPEIEELIAEQADEKNLPEDLLREIYLKEKEKVTMDLRKGLKPQLRRLLEKYVDEGWMPE